MDPFWTQIIAHFPSFSSSVSDVSHFLRLEQFSWQRSLDFCWPIHGSELKGGHRIHHGGRRASCLTTPPPNFRLRSVCGLEVRGRTWLLLGSMFYIFAYCGLVGNAHLTAKMSGTCPLNCYSLFLLLPFQLQPRGSRKPHLPSRARTYPWLSFPPVGGLDWWVGLAKQMCTNHFSIPSP